MSVDRELRDDSLLGDMDELDEKDALFCAYFEGELTVEERQAFERRRGEDAALEREYQEFVHVMGGLRSLPVEFAPEDFVEKLQSRMRTRSRGRLFAESVLLSTRMPYEIIAIVMLITMGGAYLMLEAPHDSDLRVAESAVSAPADEAP